MRLVDADKLNIYKALVEIRTDDDAVIYAGKRKIVLADDVANALTVDAVEVVRCKDCVYCKRFNDVWYLPKRDELLCTRCVETYHTTENDYCSWGERREDG